MGSRSGEKVRRLRLMPMPMTAYLSMAVGPAEGSSDGEGDWAAVWAVCSMRMPATLREGWLGWAPSF